MNKFKLSLNILPLLVVTILSLASCLESDGETIYANHGRSGKAGQGVTSLSRTAEQGIDLTKNFLVTMLKNTDTTIFSDFDAKYQQENLIQIINDISLASGQDKLNITEDTDPNDYFILDKDQKKILLTKQFIDKFGSYRFNQSYDNDLIQIKLITKIFFEAVFKLISIESETFTHGKQLGELFAETFLNHLLSDTRICQGKIDSQNVYFIINPQTGMSFYLRQGDEVGFIGDNAHQIKEDEFSSQSLWSLGYTFPFFNAKGELAQTGINNTTNKEFKFNQTTPFGPYSLIELVKSRASNDISGILNSSKPEIIFWKFVNQKAEYTFDSNEDADSKDLVNIQFILQTNSSISPSKSENSLTIEVITNGVKDAKNSHNIPLVCNNHSTSYPLKDILKLKLSTEQDPQKILTLVTKTAKIISLKNFMALNNCADNKLATNDQAFCSKYKNKLEALENLNMDLDSETDTE